MSIFQHNHELDGKLKDDCPMCDEIRFRQSGAALRAKSADQMAERYANIARKGD